MKESNEHTHKLEGVERLFEIKSLLDFSGFPGFRDILQNTRKIVKEGTVRVTHANKQQDLYTFVFNQIIIFTKPFTRKKKLWYKVKHRPLLVNASDFSVAPCEGKLFQLCYH